MRLSSATRPDCLRFHLWYRLLDSCSSGQDNLRWGSHCFGYNLWLGDLLAWHENWFSSWSHLHRRFLLWCNMSMPCLFIFLPVVEWFYFFMLMIWVSRVMPQLIFSPLNILSNGSLRWRMLELVNIFWVLRLPMTLVNICCLSKNIKLIWSLRLSYQMMWYMILLCNFIRSWHLI